MRKIRDNLMPLSLILLIPIINIFYSVLNTSNRPVFNLVTAIDNKIPFIPAFIIPYISWYGFIILILIYFCLYDKKTYYKTLISLIMGLVVCYITYFVFQTTVPRPQIQGSDIYARLVLFIYETDKPYNCFPSIHVFTCFLMIRGICSSKAKNKKNITMISVMSIIIIISTLFVKQHIIADVLSGILLADVVFDLVDANKFEKYIFILRKKASKIQSNKELET